MPNGGLTDYEELPLVAELAEKLDAQWTRLEVRAAAMSEPELIALCRAELRSLRS